ncbi:MAG: alanine racemase [Anaerostipes sp.]|nr:alanine racemase [Anaerostipes sp.]
MEEYFRVKAEIDLSAIVHNIKEVMRVVGKDTKVMAVIKADGYGHGAVPIAQELDKIGIGGYAVAIMEEAIELREAGTKTPILILGFTAPAQYKTLIEHNVAMTMFSYDMVKELSDVAVSTGNEAKIHIKVDTGMNRIGFKPTQESLKEIKKISQLPMIQIEGIFTHFARADEKDKEAAYKQKKRYDDFVQEIEDEGIHIPVKHISNSAAIIDMDDCRKNMVRSGIITYGLYPSSDVSKNVLDLKPAMELKTHIVHIKEVDAGEGISYNGTYVTDKKTKIATIPVGYADGYPRSLSSKGRVIIRGQYAPIIGRVCMDQFMVDVTNIKDVNLMDQVTLMGQDGDVCVSADEIATMIGTINYELVCDISKRVPRFYKK